VGEFFAQFASFTSKHYDRLFSLMGQHLVIVGLSLGFSVAFALPVGYFLAKSKPASAAVIGFFSAVYSIPSLALLSVLMRYTGLGMRTAVLAISIYAQFILLRSTVTAFQSLDESVVEACRGMGLGPFETLWRVQLPLAAPVLVSGLRLASIASIGIATIAATIHSGGIGELLFEGIRTIYAVKIVWGVIMSSALAFAANRLIGWAERYFTRRARGEGAPPKGGAELAQEGASI
jgi:osmoprotectant transport system permease protein